MHHRPISLCFRAVLVVVVVALGVAVAACSEDTVGGTGINDGLDDDAGLSDTGDAGLSDTGDADDPDADDPDADDPDADDPDENACGGDEELLFEDSQAQPGEPCGECGDGVLVCDGIDKLECVGTTDTNVCDGCEPVVGQPDEACGPCDDGAYVCTAEGELECQGASAQNQCGGCTDLEGFPGAGCELDDGGSGVLSCASGDELHCVAADENACGGTSTLDGQPGTPCGECHDGIWVCDGDGVVCDGAKEGNECGGCAPLAGEPDEVCGECQGELVCAGEEEMFCEDAQNACGGCADLGDAVPGESCDDGAIWACTSLNDVACIEEPTNACAGEESLESLPGEICGECGDGQTVCASPESVVCVGGTDFNECGGCGLLPGTDGESCGPGAVWECTDDGSMECAVEDEGNSCGGDEELEAAPGTACGPCDLDVYQCVGENEVQCSGTTACPAPQGVTATQGTYSTHVEVSWDSVAGAEDYVVYREGAYVDTVDASQTFYDDFDAPPPPAPGAPTDVDTDVDADGDFIDVTWEEAQTDGGPTRIYTVEAVFSGATSDESGGAEGYRGEAPVDYQIEIDGDDNWIDVGSALEYHHDEVEAGSVTAGSVSAGLGDDIDGVQIDTDAAQTDDGESYSYRVRAIHEVDGQIEAGPESAGVDADIEVSNLAYQWQRTNTDDPNASFQPLTVGCANSTSCFDDSAPTSGEERYYRVEVTADGAETTHSDVALGAVAVLELTVDAQPPPEVEAGDAIPFQLQVVNQYDDAFEESGLDATVQLSHNEFDDGSTEVSGVTDSEGVIEVEPVIVDADDDYVLTAIGSGELSQEQVESDSFDVVASAPSAAHSEISGESGVPADGDSEAQVEVTLVDEYGNPVEGVTPEFEASGTGNDYGSCTETDDDGVATCTMTSTDAGEQTLTITSPVESDGETIIFACPDTTFLRGSGEANDPYEICSADQLNHAADEQPDTAFRIVRDIDMDELDGSFSIIGDEDEPFEGQFDGGGHRIANLELDRDDEPHVGLFGIVSGADIEDIDFVDADVTAEAHVGILVGRADDASTISGCSATGEIEGLDERGTGGLVGTLSGDSLVSESWADVEVESEYISVGGLVGRALDSTVERSVARGDVTSTERNAGGLVGWHDGSTTRDSYATGDVVSGDERVGGLVGADSGGEIIHSYATGDVEASSGLLDSNAGPLVGDPSGPITNSYWSTEAECQPDCNSAGEGLDDDQMGDEAEFEDWDFGTIWTMPAGGPPTLIWEE